MDYTYTIKVIDKATKTVVKKMEVIGFNKAHELATKNRSGIGRNFYYVTVTRND